MPKLKGTGTKDKPWQLATPPGTSQFEAYRDPSADPPAIVVQVGKTQLRYHDRCIEDLHAMLVAHGDWMLGCVIRWDELASRRDFDSGGLRHEGIGIECAHGVSLRARPDLPSLLADSALKAWLGY